jgi:hypothetical protein
MLEWSRGIVAASALLLVLFTRVRGIEILGSSQYQATPLRPATLRIVPEKRIGRIGAPLATIEGRLCYRPLRLAKVQLPQGFLFLRPSTLMHERRGQTGSND